MMQYLKWLDIPPVWLASLGLAGQLIAGLLIGAGLILIVLAVIEMRKFRTTVIPHLEAGHLVTSGIFKRTRNPIYLGDALLLAGLILRWEAVLALPLVPVFVWVIERRFILAEEGRLARKFGKAYGAYMRATRRWI
jgi:protein-S-isoprenylcysteine O-methyltransferase Ste14